MYRILIADDEGIAVDSITYILEEVYGKQCEIRSARTGRSVIEIADGFHPDIAVMDIQMPGISGIEAIREIKKLSPQTRYIVVSAYDTFDYAKEAIDLGVVSYLTKPLDRDSFVSAMNTAMGMVDREKERRSSALRTQEKLRTVIPLIESEFLLELLLKSPAEEEIEQFRALLEIQEKSGLILVVECGDAGKAGPGAEAGQEDAALENPIGSGIRIRKFYDQIRNILKSRIPGVLVGQIMVNQLPVLIPHSSAPQDLTERTQTIDACRQIIEQLEERTEVRFRIGIGTVHGMQDMRSSYREAQRALTNGTDPVSHADDLAVLCVYEESYPAKLEHELFESVQKGEADAAGDSADRFFSWMADTQLSSDEESVRLKALEFVLWAEHIAYSSGSLGQYRFRSRSGYLKFVQTADMNELRVWFVRRFREAAGKIGEKSESHAGSLIGEAVRYIRENYQRDISLEDVSRAIGISPYYFSKLFREKTDSTFIEYLTSLRMSRAKELLSDPSLNIRTVCGAVGYQDPNYFSRIFKRTCGVTPTEFRQSKAGTSS